MNLDDLFSTSKRVIVFDVETTGVTKEDRIVEFACLDLQRAKSKRQYCHKYVNPKRESHPDAQAIHGLSNEFLSSQPDFRSEAVWLHMALNDSVVVTHNARSDKHAVESEFARENLRPPKAVWIDSLAYANTIYPREENDLGALARRLGVTESERETHSALENAKLLDEVLVAIKRRRGTTQTKDRRVNKKAEDSLWQNLRDAAYMSIGFVIYALVIFVIVRYFFFMDL